MERGFSRLGAYARARVLYYYQVGYYTLELDEDVNVQAELFPHYNEIFTGADMDPEIVEFLKEIQARYAA